MNEENRNFIKDYLEKLKEEGKKIDSAFIQDYLGTGATIEYFIYRELQKYFSEEDIEKKLGEDTFKRVNEIMNAYMNGIEGQDVSDWDYFSELSQAEFEKLRFDEGTKFSQGTIDKFNPEGILTRGNTQIENQATNGDKLHIAIIDVEESTDNNYHGGTAKSIFNSINPNCEVHFFGVGSEDQDRAKAVQEIIAYNESHEESQKIKLISCSHGLGKKEIESIENGNLKVISAGNLHGHFFEYFRFDNGTYAVPRLTLDEETRIRERYFDHNPDPDSEQDFVRAIAEGFVGRFKALDNAILVNVNLAIGQPTKRHECDISVSWGVPVVAAYYAMALRANPDMSYEEFYGICQECSSEKNHILDEDLFMEKIQAIEQQRISDSQSKKRSLGDDCPEAVKGSDLSYRTGLINETTRAIRADLVREEEKEQNNDDPNIE